MVKSLIRVEECQQAWGQNSLEGRLPNNGDRKRNRGSKAGTNTSKNAVAERSQLEGARARWKFIRKLHVNCIRKRRTLREGALENKNAPSCVQDLGNP